MKIIYLHGFNSSKESETVKTLEKIYGEKLISISYDYINPDIAHNQIEKLIKDTWEEDKNIILIGSSLGGFWANYFLQTLHLKALLINPSIKPSETIKKYLGINKNFSTGKEFTLKESDFEKYKNYELPLNQSSFRIILLGDKDTVIDPYNSAVYFHNCKVVWSLGMEHRITNKQTPLIQRLIEEINNTYTL